MYRSEYYLTLSGDIKARYDAKIEIIDDVDPYAIRRAECQLDILQLPNIKMIDLVNYLILTHSYYTGQQLKAYKSLQAFKQYESGSVQEILAKQINQEAFVVISKSYGGGSKSTYSHFSSKDVQYFRMMNSTKPLSAFSENNEIFHSPTKKNTYFEYDFTDGKSKKYRKWSFGNLFRRKKKVIDSSSEDEMKKINTEKKKKNSETKNKSITFDHVIYPQQHIASFKNNVKTQDNQVRRKMFDHSETNFEHNSPSSENKIKPFYQLDDMNTRIPREQSSLESINKKCRKESTKIRASVRKTPLNCDTSSDEDSQISNSSHRMRSDESISKSKDSGSSRRSRASRTERYLRRHSRVGEPSTNRTCKSDAESYLLRSNEKSQCANPSQLENSYSVGRITPQSPSILGVSTIPPSHIYYNKFMHNNSMRNPRYYSPSIHLHSSGYNSCNKRCHSFDTNINSSGEYGINHGDLELEQSLSKNLTSNDNFHTKQYCNTHNMPQPPLRDRTKIPYFDKGNQNSNYMNISPVQLNHNYLTGSSSTHENRINTSNLQSSFKSASEDYIPRYNQIPLTRRPSSTTPMSDKTWLSCKPDHESRFDNYQYLTDKQPRSRKPILIQNTPKKSKSHTETINMAKLSGDNIVSTTFLDQLKAKKTRRDNSECSSQIYSPQTKLQSNIFLPSVIPDISSDDEALKKDIVASNIHQTENESNTPNPNVKSSSNRNSIEKKTANLEEALNELETIYNSLKLGDENLLEMAEKREEEEAKKKILDNINRYQSRSVPSGTLSDSGLSYEMLNTINATRRRSTQHPPKSDDMAFRKIVRGDRAATITDPENIVSKFSCLYPSPLYSRMKKIRPDKTDISKPDITFDDVVYRNTNQLNKYQLPEHPPPFGIPLGPIALGANSDYLHCVPCKKSVKPSIIPDLVKDDLAYRTLRKDNNTMVPSLPPVSNDDIKNNNIGNSGCEKNDLHRISSSDIKKKRAIRSKSANISSLICQEVIERASRRNAREKNSETESNTLSDIANAMQVAHQVLKDKEMKIKDNKRASLSDTDSGNSKYTQYASLCGEDPLEREKCVDFNSERNTKISPTAKMTEFVKPPLVEPLAEICTVRSEYMGVSPTASSSYIENPLRTSFSNNSCEDILTALAIEAKEASNKFAQDLNELKIITFPSFERTENLKVKNIQDDKKFHEINNDLEEKSSDIMTDKTKHECFLDNIEEHKKNEEPMSKPQNVESIASALSSRKDVNIDSDHDYENIDADVETETDGKHVPAELERRVDVRSAHNNTNSFELDTEDLVGICNDKTSGEICVDVVETNAFHSVRECNRKCNVIEENKRSFAVFDNDIDSSRLFFQSSIREHVAPINPHSFESFQNSKLKVSETLKSPKLVLETACSMCSYSHSEQNSDKNFKTSKNSELGHVFDNFGPTHSCHNYNTTLAIACSFGVACFHQLAFLDLLTVLSIIFAVVTCIAVIFI